MPSDEALQSARLCAHKDSSTTEQYKHTLLLHTLVLLDVPSLFYQLNMLELFENGVFKALKFF